MAFSSAALPSRAAVSLGYLVWAFTTRRGKEGDFSTWHSNLSCYFCFFKITNRRCPEMKVKEEDYKNEMFDTYLQYTQASGKETCRNCNPQL